MFWIVDNQTHQRRSIGLLKAQSHVNILTNQLVSFQILSIYIFYHENCIRVYSGL